MPEAYPIIRDIGLTGKLVTFAETLTERANRAALAFRAKIEAQHWQGIEESATSLASVFIRFDPFKINHDDLQAQLTELLNTQNWFTAALPTGRTLWTIPVAVGGTNGPEFIEAAELAGVPPEIAKAEIISAQVRVLTLGFAPGQPYMGQLPDHWNIPRMHKLNPQVPGASLVIAIRQLIIFGGPAPTGWRHIGQTAFQCFRPDQPRPIALTPGDEVTFREITAEELEHISAHNDSGDGGATRTAVL